MISGQTSLSVAKSPSAPVERRSGFDSFHSIGDVREPAGWRDCAERAVSDRAEISICIPGKLYWANLRVIPFREAATFE
jgi:hypothetical protein